MDALEAKVALVTGAASGMGRAIAERFAKEGAQVWVADIADQAAAAVANDVGAGAKAVFLDVTDANSIAKAMDEVGSGSQGIDILVNAAGIHESEPWLEISRESFDRVFAVNTRGMLFMTQAAVSGMLKHQRGGAIVTILSVGCRHADPSTVTYSASKAAGMSLTQSAAQAFAGNNIRVNAIAPGPVRTPMYERNLQLLSAQLGKTPQEMDRSWAKNVPLGRVAAASEIADVAVFLCSDQSGYVTGQTLNVDGGMFTD